MEKDDTKYAENWIVQNTNAETDQFKYNKKREKNEFVSAGPVVVSVCYFLQFVYHCIICEFEG